MRIGKLLLGLGFALLASPLIHATTFSTVGDQNSTLSSWGASSTNTYGETFVAPGGDLTSFSFYFSGGSGTTDATAEVYAWSGSLLGGNSPQGTVGTALFSAPVTITGNSITVDTGSVPLTTGDNYIVLLTNPSNDNYSTWAIDTSHPANSGGGGANFNNGPAAGTYDDFVDAGTLEYTATFSGGAGGVVPEPSSFILLVTGVLGLAGLARRRSAC